MIKRLERFRLIDVIICSTVVVFFLKQIAPIERFLLFSFTIFLTNYFVFSINDFMDKDKDSLDIEKSSRNPFLNEKYKKTAVTLMTLSGALLVLSGIFYPDKLYTNIILLVIGYSYSGGIRAKNKPLLDVLFHGLWSIGMIAYGLILFDMPVTIREITLLFQIFIVSTLIELSQEIRDYDVDKKGNENTTVVFLGLRNTKIVYALSIVLFAVITPITVNHPYLGYLSLLFVPMYFLTPQKTFEQRIPLIWLLYILSAVIFLL